MESHKYKILLVDDEPDILEFLSYNLNKAGYIIFQARTGKEAIQKAREVLPHLVLLDVMMPEMDGIETCEQLRTYPELRKCIIAFLTARSEDYSQIAGFDAGGDDYISKPVKPKVLISRIKALLKRIDNFSFLNSEETNNEEIDISTDNIIIDKERYLVIKGKEELLLPKKEFELLALLMSKPDKVFTREDIFHMVWGDNIIVGDRTIDVHIRKLREKIGEDFIKTIKGVGYKYIG